ncbi:MAG: tetratricopeptide repeat protein [Gammaproteobacteria bacterium]|nr:tetratricopeptide repeat protein [Gammaproteobacteria bacterium]
MKSETKDASLAIAIDALRCGRPLRAEESCRDYLVMNPGCIDHLRLLGKALLKQNRLPEAETQLRFALSLNAGIPQLHEDLGSALALQKKFEEAIPFLEKAIQLEPRLPLAHKKLGQALFAVGRGAEADEQFEEYFDKDPESGAVALGMDHFKAGRKDEAIAAFRGVLRSNPDNVDAMRQLAIVYWRGDKNLSDAEALLRRAAEKAADFVSIRLVLGAVLIDANKHTDAIESYEVAAKLEPDNPAAWSGLGNAYAQASYPEKSISAFAKSLELQSDSPATQMGYAHVLKTVGDQPGAVKAYRAAIAGKPNFGEAYWSLANLKVFEFEESEVSAMEKQLTQSGLTDSEEVHFRFSLGKTYEDRKDYERAWHYYDTGNKKQRPLVSHDPLEMELRHAEILKTFDPAFIREHSGNGCDAADPILIVGLPRSGSTLVEQILASHSQVEGTSELPALSKIAASMGRYRPDDMQFPRAVHELRGKDWRAYGMQYLEAAQRHRQSDRPFFTDKLPNNFPLVGLLHLILPNAKVINARRHPLDSCMGGYKQLFARGQNFTYDLADLSHYYRNYDAVMKHWHEVLPGKVLDVHYEETVSDLESQVRRILDHCGLPFEESCVRFHETKRAVKTASSEQVRQPIYSGALGKWRKYQGHLDMWIEDLDDIIADLPDVVRNAGV